MAKHAAELVPERIASRIAWVREEKVLLDDDLAEMYGVETRTLNQAVKRNADRFPEDFMFRLTAEEAANLRSQFVTASHGGRRTLPYAFTEQGVAMLSSVLRSKRAVQVNVEIMRTFVKLRRILATHADLARKLEQMEAKYDKQFATIFAAIRALMSEETGAPSAYAGKSRRIGYQSKA